MSRPHFAFVAGLDRPRRHAGAGQSSGPAMSADALKGLEFRSIGPTLSTGRVADITADPNRPDVYYVASAVGGLWKSENRGNTWHSVFDNGGSFNMCCVVVDPKNSDNVWLGTGENSNPRSATYGDGLYKSTDGGEHFTRVGLETSEHIGAIKIDPAQLGRRLGGGAGPAVVHGWRSRHLQDDRWRQDVEGRRTPSAPTRARMTS